MRDLIDRNRFNPPLRGITVGQFIVDKLVGLGYLGEREEWGVKDHHGNVHAFALRSDAVHASQVMGLPLVHHIAPEWKEYKNEISET